MKPMHHQHNTAYKQVQSFQSADGAQNKTWGIIVNDQVLLATWEILKNSNKRDYKKKSNLKSAELHLLTQAEILAL